MIRADIAPSEKARIASPFFAVNRNSLIDYKHPKFVHRISRNRVVQDKRMCAISLLVFGSTNHKHGEASTM